MRQSQVLVCLLTVAAIAEAQEKPQPLPAVPVTAESEPIRSAKLREFDRRRSQGIGRFLTEADLEKDQYRNFSDALRKLPGITMVSPKRTMAGYSSSAVFVMSSRGSATIEHASPVFGKNCPIAIWLDGVPVYRGLDRFASSPALSKSGGGGPGPGTLLEPPFDINSIMTNHVAAVEFYSGPGTMPPELNATQGSCGALVIWTK